MYSGCSGGGNMKIQITSGFRLLLLGLMVTGSLSHGFANAASQDDVLRGNYPRLQDGVLVDLAQFKGKTVLVVNTASQCGYTGQYEGLEKLYSKYKSDGLVVLGFPSNSFKQEYSSDQKIADFCKNTYAIEFPMFSAVEVVGPNRAPLYDLLAAKTGQFVRWNFNKYLIGRDGQVLAYFPSQTKPLDSKLEELVRTDLGF